MGELEHNTEMTDDQVDELYSRISGGQSSEIQMDEPTPEQAEPAPSMFKLGEQEYTQDQLLEIAQKGLDYTPVVDKYKQIDEYAIQNPEWWDHVQNAFTENNGKPNENVDNNDSINNNNIDREQLTPELQTVFDQLTEHSKIISEFKLEQANKARAEEDNQLDTEISSIREGNPNIDFQAKNEAGHTLEQRVLKHAQQIGTSSFRAAFRDLMHDTLVSKAQETAKEQIGKDIERKTKLGILDVKTPSVKKNEVTKAENVKGKSYDDLLAETLKELGI